MEKRKVSKAGSIALVAALSVGAFGMLPMAFDSASASYENYNPSKTARTWKNYTLNPTPKHYDDSIKTMEDVHKNNFDATLFQKTNEERKKRGLPELKTTVELDDLADARAREIEKDFSHAGFGGRTPGPYSKSGENIYMFPGLYSYMDYPELMNWDFSWHYAQPFEGYKASTKGHWEALMNPEYTHMGVSTYVNEETGDVMNAVIFAKYDMPKTDGAPDKTEVPLPKLIDPKTWNKTKPQTPDPLIEFLNNKNNPKPTEPSKPTTPPTQKPTENPKPTTDPKPTTPKPTDPPKETETPKPSDPPKQTETPKPTPTENPKPTNPPVDPKPTDSPKPSETPKPDPTEVPKPTENPKPTESPKPTENPKPSEPVPEPTKEPTKPTEEPKPTETPKPSEEPEPTPTEKPETPNPEDPKPTENPSPETPEPTEPSDEETTDPSEPDYTVDENGVKEFPKEKAESGTFESSFSSSLTRDRFVMDDSGKVRDMSDFDSRAMKDLDPKDPNTVNIIRAYEAGITRGFVKSDGVNFEPDVDVSRLDASVMLYRMYLAPKVDHPADSPFVDLSSDNTFYDAALWTDQKDLITANDKNEFRPDGTIGRGEMTNILYKAEGEPTYVPVDPYDDVNKDAPYAVSSEWFKSEGSIDAWKDNDSLYPEQPVSRGEFISSLFVTDAPRNMAK